MSGWETLFRRLPSRSTKALTLLVLSLLTVTIVRLRQTDRTPSAEMLAQLQSRTPPGMVLVPGGDFWFGTDDADADDDVKPKRRISLASFYIDVHEVTNAEFHEFDRSHVFLASQARLPVTNVTYDRAATYAHWAGKRLPTEEEWEKAARGTDGRRYPWGDVWDPHRVAQRAHSATGSAPPKLQQNLTCYLGPPRVRPVESLPNGVSPYGCYDMAGNAWEWVQGFYNDNRQMRILRGGAVGYGENADRTYNRAIEGAGDT